VSTVFLNGRFVERSEAQVSAFDAGFQHGVGLFETMLAVGGALGPRVIDLDAHIERLETSARALGLSESLSGPALADAVMETVRQSGLVDDAGRARVRLTLSGGDLNMLGPAGGEHDPTVLIVAQRATEYPGAMFERGVAVTIAGLKVNPLDPTAGHKTLNYWARLRELQIAAGKRAGEALVFQVTNFLSGGCVSNCFIAKDGALYTPIAQGEEDDVAPAAAGGQASPSPVLPGVTRAWVTDWAAENGVRVHRRMVSISEILGADEVFLTNSSWGVLPAVKVEAEAIGDGVVGPLSQRLVKAWREKIENE
jgi:branched-chain amino acid aminotransferase